MQAGLEASQIMMKRLIIYKRPLGRPLGDEFKDLMKPNFDHLRWWNMRIGNTREESYV
jgi:hypothetical protein